MFEIPHVTVLLRRVHLRFVLQENILQAIAYADKFYVDSGAVNVDDSSTYFISRSVFQVFYYGISSQFPIA